MQFSGFRRGCAAVALMTLSLTLTACGGQAPPTDSVAQTPAAQPGTGAATTIAQPDGECATVQQIAPDSAEGKQIGEALLAALPAAQSPEMQKLAPYAFDEVWSIAKVDNWIVVQASFKQALEPGIFVMEATSSGYRYESLGWSGMADSAATLRGELAQKLPDAARSLAACIDVTRWSVS